ncbi:MAG: transposase [Deltaproteobacteria bacterium]|nr:transposase [Nannocystaceae bacterium]
MAKSKQLELVLPTHGGARKGAGRKRSTPRPTVPHVARPAFVASRPVQVTMRVVAGVSSLRANDVWSVVVDTLRALRQLSSFRVVHLSVMSNHLHLLVEADDGDAFEYGMRALTVRLALRINRVLGRRGRLFENRYHARALATPREVALSLQYVLLNARKHAAERGRELPHEWVDPRSSAPAFDGWEGRSAVCPDERDFGVALARTWLLRVGWRRYGLLRVDAVPGATHRRLADAA